MSNPLVEAALRSHDEAVSRARVNRILLAAAREAYLPEPDDEPGIPLDLRCVGCGVTRDRCDHVECHQEWLRKEREA